jgi:enamine deaminase RidA (YjgF/YER057c/UK114 family)
MVLRIESGKRLSKVVVANGFAFLSGFTANVVTPGDVRAQTADVLAQIDALLAKAGTSKSKVVRMNIWLDDMRDFDAMNEVYEAWIDPDCPPARATVESRLAIEGTLVEMMATAIVD